MNFEKVKEVMINTLNCDEEKITMEATLASDLNIDSLDAVELVMALEEEFEVEIPTEDLENIKTIGDVESYLQSRQ